MDSLKNTGKGDVKSVTPGKLVLIGVLYMILSLLQQFMVNKLVITAAVVIVASALIAWYLKTEGKLFIVPIAAGVLNLPGLFIRRYTMVEILGLVTFAVGIFFAVLGIVRLFKVKAGRGKKIGAICGAAFVFLLAGFLNFTAVFPMRTMILMGKPLNITIAEQSESTLEDGIRLISNVQYDSEMPNGFLDIYYTSEDSENAPVLIWIHGGGYMWGDKEAGDPNAENSNFESSTGGRFLAQGYNVVQMNYVLAVSKDYRFPAAIKQLNRGLKFLADHGEEYGLNMENVVIGGASAGGNLAGTLINIQTNPDYAAVVGETAAIDASCIKAGVFEGGLFDNSRFGRTGSVIVDWSFLQLGRSYLGINELATNEEVVKPSNVLDWVSADFVPSFISDGNSGTFTDQAVDMSELLTGYGIPNELCTFSKEEATLIHGYEESGSEFADKTFERMFEFLEEYVR